MQQVGKTECMFEQTNPEENKLINFIIGIPFNFCLTFTAIVFNKASLEIIYTQAPYNMNGLLLGFFSTLQTIFMTLGNIWYNDWTPVHVVSGST